MLLSLRIPAAFCITYHHNNILHIFSRQVTASFIPLWHIFKSKWILIIWFASALWVFKQSEGYETNNIFQLKKKIHSCIVNQEVSNLCCFFCKLDKDNSCRDCRDSQPCSFLQYNIIPWCVVNYTFNRLVDIEKRGSGSLDVLVIIISKVDTG